MSIVTFFSGDVLAIVPAHTKPHPKRQLDWLKTEDAKSKDAKSKDAKTKDAKSKNAKAKIASKSSETSPVVTYNGPASAADVARVKTAVGLARQGKTSQATDEQHAISDPAAGFARILPDHNARLRLGLDQIMPEGASDQKSALGGEREFSSHAPNPVGPEKLSSLRGHCDWDGGDRAGTRSIIIVIVTGCGSTT